MRKYNNAITFKSIAEAKQFPLIKKIKMLRSFGELPKGLIIEYLDTTWDERKDYVLSPLYGFGNYVIVPKEYAKEV